MLPEPKLKLLQDLVSSSSREELIWLNGYLAGLLEHSGTPDHKAEPAHQKPAVNKITITYGTESGNSKKLATDFATRAKRQGINAKVVSLDQYRFNDLPKEEYFFTVISTQGEGEPPSAAKKFYDHIHHNGFKLDKLKFGVLALGDTAYPLFCKAGEDVDAQLQKLGGQRIVTMQKCDTDYESDAAGWFSHVLNTLNNSGASVQASNPALPAKKTGKKIYTGTVLTNVNLNDRGSNKRTHHIEIEAEDIVYEPGDSIGIVPQNPKLVVEAILKITGLDQEKSIPHRLGEDRIGNLLHTKLNVVYLPERVVKQYAAIVQQEIPETKISLLDLLKIYPVRDTLQAEEVLAILEPIAPRLYSIASSPEAHSGEVHITVSYDTFQVNEDIKHGLCSDFLIQFAEGETLHFYVHKNSQFRLPDADKDIIMVGPGTGIAPFRSFLAQRDSTGANGRNWLFFGDQHFLTDFLYQTEFQSWIQTGVLNTLNVAFSRDQQEKVYVQHKMIKHGAELYSWINSGAHFYVCGAKDPMSEDVERTLLYLIREQGNKSLEEAELYLEQLKEEGRYVKDVY